MDLPVQPRLRASDTSHDLTIQPTRRDETTDVEHPDIEVSRTTTPSSHHCAPRDINSPTKAVGGSRLRQFGTLSTYASQGGHRSGAAPCRLGRKAASSLRSHRVRTRPAASRSQERGARSS